MTRLPAPSRPTTSIWNALVTPARAIEVRAWMRRSPQEALALRGESQETALHWIAMNDLGALIDGLAIGMDPNALDNSGRTPLDWLNDRLWLACVAHEWGLDASGQARLRLQTEELVPALWGFGGRSSHAEEARDPVQTWARAGAWVLLPLLVSPGSLDGWRYRGVQGASMLHYWILAPDTAAKHTFLTQALAQGLSVDEPDRNGRTPLWYAVDAWCAKPEWGTLLRPAIAALLAHGADPHRSDKEGLSPMGFLLHKEIPEGVLGPLEEVLSTAADVVVE